VAKLQNLPVKAKARRFKALLPIIERKIAEGVHHKDIIEALRDEGLALPENTYFTYLRRYRSQNSRTTDRSAPVRALDASGPKPPAGQPPLVPSSSGDADRPPRFDYDPRGIPDLLK
jgi:hypothetical protein